MEELQRRCISHERKPLSKALKEEIREQEEKEKAKKEKEEEKEGGGAEELEEAKKEGEGETAEEKKDKENREWKRNGGLMCDNLDNLCLYMGADERWLDWLDSKIALLLHRDNLNPADYGGKSYEELVSLCCSDRDRRSS
jgi:TATA-binding protein-associated factor Taf7